MRWLLVGVLGLLLMATGVWARVDTLYCVNSGTVYGGNGTPVITNYDSVEYRGGQNGINDTRGWLKYSTSGIILSSGEYVTGVQVWYYGFSVNYPWFDIWSLENDPASSSASTIYGDAAAGTRYFQYQGNPLSIGWRSIDLGSSAVTAVTQSLTTTHWFGVGIDETDNETVYYDFCYGYGGPVGFIPYLLVTIHSPQPNETCASAIVVNALPYSTSGTLGITNDCVGVPYNDVFYRLTTPSAGSYTFDMCNSSGDTYLRVWTSGTCCSGSYVDGDDECGSYDPRISVVLDSNQTVYIECGYYSATGSPAAFNFNISAPSSPSLNETCATATIVTALPYSTSGTLGATDDCTGRPYNDLFYRMTAPIAGNYIIDMCNSTGDTYLTVWTSGICCSGSYVHGDNECGGSDPRVTVALTANQTVYIECGNRYSTGGQVAFNFNITPPVIPPNCGGPDAGGYYWANSLGDTCPSHPRYEWRDVRTDLFFLDDDGNAGPYSIGFPFTFYGNTYTSFYICANGFLTFLPITNLYYNNYSIPNSSVPNATLCWFWDDLNPALSDSAFWGHDVNGDLVVSFIGYHRYNASGTITAQVILKSNGNVKYQYASLSGGISTTSSTIGIESSSGTIGTQYLYNGIQHVLLNNFAIEFGLNASTLPVELTSFEASAMNQAVRLHWVTASETGNDHFILYRSTSQEGQFSQITTVDGAGESVSENIYNFVDRNLVNGVTYYYRIADVDFNGNATTYDLTVNATPSNGALGIVITEYKLHQNYPNPFNPNTTITYDVKETGHVTLKIYNLLGQEVATLVNEVKDNNRYQTTFDASGLAAGVYFYRVNVNDFSSVQKMILLK